MSGRADVVLSQLILLRHRSGEQRALAELVDLWERPLLYYLRRLLDTEEDAWDALQETWMRVVRELPRLRDDAAFPAWGFAVARRVAFRARRRAHPAEALPEDDDPGAVTADEPSLAGFDPLDIHRALGGLTLPQRDALTLHFLEGFSISEIARITGAPEGTVKSRLFHARRALRTRLEGGMS